MTPAVDESVTFVDDAGMAVWLQRLGEYPALTRHTIGESRAGRPLYGFQAGAGPIFVTITAGAHADEPAGPLAAMHLLLQYARDPEALFGAHHREITLLVCPQVNPDGAQVNSRWFSPVPDLTTYVRHVKRELPGDDVEFGYPGRGKGSLRPENQAVADFFSGYSPAAVHASLHSMAFAEGAWYLLGGRAREDSALQRELVELSAAYGFRLHDIERRGEKGFTRIAPGFCTTPDSGAMARFFEEQDDSATAEKFHLSSMEWTLERNPDAAILVTELPTFALAGGYTGAGLAVPAPQGFGTSLAPEPGSTVYENFRKLLKSLDLGTNKSGLQKLINSFEITPVPFTRQCELMVAAVARLVRNSLEKK